MRTDSQFSLQQLLLENCILFPQKLKKERKSITLILITEMFSVFVCSFKSVRICIAHQIYVHIFKVLQRSHIMEV